MFHFYTPWKCQATYDFLMFSGDIEIEHWHEIAYYVNPPQLLLAGHYFSLFNNYLIVF